MGHPTEQAVHTQLVSFAETHLRRQEFVACGAVRILLVRSGAARLVRRADALRERNGEGVNSPASLS